MLRAIRKPFGYEPILSKEDIKGPGRRKGSGQVTGNLSFIGFGNLVDEQRALLIIVLALVFVSSVLALLGPFMVGKIIDQHIVAKDFDGLAVKIGLLVFVYIGLSLSMYFQNYWMVGIAQQTIYRLRTNLFAHLQKLPIPFFDKRQHGELMSRMTNDIENVSQTLNTSFIQVFSSILTLTGTVAVMLYLSPLLTLLTMIIIPVMFIGMRWITRRTGKLFKEQQQAVGELNGMIEETISGQRIVKAFSQENRMMEEFEQKSDRPRRTGILGTDILRFYSKSDEYAKQRELRNSSGCWGAIGTKRGRHCYNRDNRYFLGIGAAVHSST